MEKFQGLVRKGIQPALEKMISEGLPFWQRPIEGLFAPYERILANLKPRYRDQRLDTRSRIRLGYAGYWTDRPLLFPGPRSLFQEN